MNNNRNFNPAVCAAVHKVRPGETLYGIARDYNTDYQRLMMLNGITNPNNIAIGQEICIPHGSNNSAGSAGNNGTNAIPRPDRPSPGPQQRPANRTHTIATGDTLYGISRNYGVSLASLMSCNPGIDPYNLQVGSKLNVPPASRPSAAAPRVSDADNNNNNITTTATPEAPTPQTSVSQASTPQTPASQPSPSSDIRTVTANSSASDTMTDNSANRIIAAAPETTNNIIQNSEHESSEMHADGIIHTVGENESLTDILTQFNVCYHALLHENPGTDFTSDITGLSICIPYDDVFAKSPENQPYIVKSGDTLMTISETSGIPSDDLLRMNPCCNILHFSTPGTRLRI